MYRRGLGQDFSSRKPIPPLLTNQWEETAFDASYPSVPHPVVYSIERLFKISYNYSHDFAI